MDFSQPPQEQINFLSNYLTAIRPWTSAGPRSPAGGAGHPLISFSENLEIGKPVISAMLVRAAMPAFHFFRWPRRKRKIDFPAALPGGKPVEARGNFPFIRLRFTGTSGKTVRSREPALRLSQMGEAESAKDGPVPMTCRTGGTCGREIPRFFP